MKSPIINAKFTINMELLEKKLYKASEHFVSMESDCINDVCIDKYLEGVISYLLISDSSIIQVTTKFSEK